MEIVTWSYEPFTAVARDNEGNEIEVNWNGEEIAIMGPPLTCVVMDSEDALQLAVDLIETCVAVRFANEIDQVKAILAKVRCV